MEIIIIPLVLSSCGIIMIASLALRSSVHIANPYMPPIKQFQFLGIGLTMMVCCMLIPTEWFKKHSGKFCVISFLLLVMSAVPGIGIKVGGARRWLSLIGFRFQPLEIALLSVPIFMADRLSNPDSLTKRGDFHSFLRPTLMVISMFIVPLMFQPNLGGAILITNICLIMHTESRGLKYPAFGAIMLTFLAILMIIIAPYRMRRFYAFWDPWDDSEGRGFQIIQGLIAFANGSLTGVGIGRGLQEEGYLPEAQTDYIFPAIGEEFGLAGTLFLISLYALWTWRAYYIYKNARSPFTKSLALGLTASVIFPMFVNIAGVTRLMPLTGIPLPFLSAGGSSMVFTWMKIGVLMAIRRENKAHEKILKVLNTQ